MILDDFVLNVDSYSQNHPGGALLIDWNIGRDISKFFYGGYAMENSWPNTHSNSAY
jgi:cytochrome b involved in lipid metabolism